MKTASAFRRSGIAALTVLILLNSFVAAAHADTFKQLNIITNQLDNADVATPFTPATSFQKRINNILKNECDPHDIFIRVTLSKLKLQQDPKDGATSIAPNGKVPNKAARKKLRELAKKGEVKNGGYKVWVAVEADANSNINGATFVGHNVSVIKQQDLFNGDYHTWLHEIGHGLGLRHIKDDPTNVLYPYRKRPNGFPSGDNLTEAQCEAMEESIDKLSPSTGKTIEQKMQPKGKSETNTMVDPPDTAPLEGTPTDMDSVQLVIDDNLINPSDNSLYAEINLNSVVSVVPTTVYSIWLDLDDNLLTGDGGGFDALMEQRFTSPAHGEVRLFELPGPNFLKMLDPLEVELTGEQVTGDTFGSESIDETMISSRVSLGDLGPIANPIRVLVTADDGLLSDSLGPEPLNTVPPTEPTLTLNPVEGSPGGLVNAVGTGFSASTPYVILVDDTEVLSAVTGPLGALDVDFPVPFRFPGDYLVDVIDSNGEVEVAVLRIPLTDTGKNTILQVSAGFLFAILGLALLKRRRSSKGIR